MKYNWQQSDWPHFSYKLDHVESSLIAFADKAGQVSGALKALPEDAQTETMLEVMISEAVKTSEIEGEYVSRPDVASSIRNQLGLNLQPDPVGDLAAQGVGELMVDVRQSWDKPLSQRMLFNWHKMLMKGMRGLAVGCWRKHTEPMQVVSGAVGKERVHFEAPGSAEVPAEMKAFISWFNASKTQIAHAPVRAAIAHLYFESIHPFEDGNGRIGRVISEKALSQGLGRPALLSLSRAIQSHKKAYYQALETAQRSNEISDWLAYFIPMVLQAQEQAEATVEHVLKKTRFFDRYRSLLNARQLRVIRRMLESGPEGFEGGMNTRKYVSIAKTSRATASRDLQDLVERGIFSPVGSGRSSRYELKL